MANKKRFVLVGTGARAVNFITQFALRFREHVELAALCDLSPTRMAYCNALLAGELGYHAVPTYRADQFEQMLDEQRAEVVIVTTTDGTHDDYIVRALRRGCDVVTEKPMTVDAAKCRRIFAAVKETGKNVQVAFNVRWAAHRTKIRELIASGVVGRVTSVHLEYLLNTSHGADYYRRWHATMAESGGLLVHKSTHHFDLVNWWIDAIPEQVFASGRLDYYGRANAVARGQEALTKYARYTGEPAAANDPFALDLSQHENFRRLYLDAEAESGYLRDRNVFRDGIDIYDNMSLAVRYRTGVLLNYSLLSFSSREGFHVAINGDRGRIEYDEYQPTHVLSDHEGAPPPAAGDRSLERIRVYPHFAPSYEVEVQRLEGEHDGSDLLLAEQIYSPNPPVDRFGRKAGYEQGAASILIGIAANESIASNRPVAIDDLVSLKPGATRLSELI
ncbi:MAG TPA: Gfo/Idh/MocA family oxidoreductase [Opitutus sp.]|nr:Gfo/Idh/MocA family oxidoreductase [Opitutus sp.]